jgi:xanthine dehydrogenase molybdenum-binding subunit
VGEIAKTAQIKSWGTMAYTGSLRQKNCPPCFITHFVEVEVNTKTGEIKIPRAVIMGDSGTIINPDLWEGQIIGAFSRGLGFGLLEETKYDLNTGKLEGNGFITDFKTATSCEMPEIDQLTVLSTDTYEPTGPFGAKGIGEAALSSVASAIANAVYNAIGIRFYELPITPEKVLKALEEKEERGEKIAD